MGHLAGGFATLWHDAKLTILWSGDGGKATAINNHGHVAIWRNDGVPRGAAIWADGKIVALEELFGHTEWKQFLAVAAMNDHGWLLCNASRGRGDEPVLIKLGPAISQQPVSRTKVPGQFVTFSSVPYTIGSAAYQWRKDGANLVNGTRVLGADTTQLTINPVAVEDAGSYELVVTDSYGTVTSSNAVLTVFGQGCLPAADGLVAQWTGDATAQEILNRYNTTLLNGVGFATGMVGSAFAFDGNDDVVTTGLNVNPSAMPTSTWETWVPPMRTQYNNPQMILSADPFNFQAVGIEAGTDQFTVFVGTSPGFGRVATVSLNEWQHIAVVFYTNRIEFYKNAERFDIGYGPLELNSQSSLSFGNTLGRAQYFQGLIDEISIYNRALSQAEIQAIYDVGAAGKCRPVAIPSITSQPPSQTTYAGFDVTFPTATVGSAPLHYQWFFNVTNAIASATNSQFTLKNAQPSGAGTYSLVVSNGFGIVKSSEATLTVRPACEGQWTRVQSRNPDNKTIMAMAVDSAKGVSVALNDRGETWIWNGSEWSTAATKGPGPRGGAKMVFDSGRQVIVLFGGTGSSSGEPLNDAWEWDGVRWLLQASSGPSPRSEHAMAYDSVRGVTVLYGGYVLWPCGGSRCPGVASDT